MYFTRENKPPRGNTNISRSIELGADSRPQPVRDSPQKPPSLDSDDDIDIPMDATEEELEAYHLDLSYWRDYMNEYEDQEVRLVYLTDYMLETAALHLREKYFDPKDSLVEWYWALRDNVR